MEVENGKLGLPEHVFTFACHRRFFLGSPKLRRSVKKLKIFGIRLSRVARCNHRPPKYRKFRTFLNTALSERTLTHGIQTDTARA